MFRTKRSTLSIFSVMLLALLLITRGAFAVSDWVMEWYALDPVKGTGTHANGYAVDWLQEEFGEEEAWFSELKNVGDIPEESANGLTWFIGNLVNNNDERNLSNGIYGGEFGDMSNYVFYGMVVVTSPKEQDTVMNVAQDDELKVWINGELAATDQSWTGGALTTRPHDISLEKGDNLFLVKVSEEGGGDYLNVNFETDELEFDAEVKEFGYSVSPADKLAATWGVIKAKR